MSYESHAHRKAMTEMKKLDALIKRGTATTYQKLRMKRLETEYGPLSQPANRPQNKTSNTGVKWLAGREDT